jgi:hypothetical protein
MRVFYDSAAGASLLVLSQSDRSAPAAGSFPNALYRWPNIAGQPDEQALARNGLALSRLVHPREVGWGPHGPNAVRAANSLPLMFPMALVGGDRRYVDWSMLNATLRATHNPTASRVLYWSGSVPGPYPNTVPRGLWKVAVSANGQGLVVDAIMLPGRGPGIKGARTTLDEIAAVTGIDFSKLKARLAQPVADPTEVLEEGEDGSAPAPASVFIQLSDVSDEQAAVVRLALAAEGLGVPPIEQVGACLKPTVRYYHDQDSQAANRVAEIAAKALRAAKFPDSNVRVQQFSLKRFPNAKQGNLELWLCASKGLKS